MAEITSADIRDLRREIEETKWLTFAVVQALYGKDSADRVLAKVREWLDDDMRRLERGTPVYEVAAYARLMDADLLTLEEIAAKPRAEVAAVPGVGRVTMRHLESAMAERGLTFADAA